MAQDAHLADGFLEQAAVLEVPVALSVEGSKELFELPCHLLLHRLLQDPGAQGPAHLLQIDSDLGSVLVLRAAAVVA